MKTTRSLGKQRPEDGAELEAARRELRVLQQRFRSIVERTADGILVVDGDGVIRFANGVAAQLFGAEDLVGTHFGTPLSSDSLEVDIVRGGGPAVAELRVMDTEWEGEPARIVSLRDVTDRKNAEERDRRLLAEQIARSRAEETARRASLLSEASRRLASSLDLEATLGTVISLVVDEFADFCILDLVLGDTVKRQVAAAGNDERSRRLEDAARFPLDVDADTPQGRAFRDCEPLHVPEVTEEWLRSATTGEDHLRAAMGLGTRSLVFVPIYTGRDCLGVLTAGRWEDSPPFDEQDFHFATELGERAALAMENARLYQAAESANRAKTNFLSVMSHELRTPLSAIIGYTDLMDRGIVGEVGEQQARFLGRIRASSNHLLQIIEEILAFASTEAGEGTVDAEPTTMDHVIDGVLTVAEPLAHDKPVDFIVEVDDPGLQLVTDARKVRQILLNLISNAFKFTTEGEVRLHAGSEGSQAVFEVSDTGVGIPEERLEKIFEKFWQAEDPMTRRAGGTGLGLAVARSVAELLSGSLDVRSIEGEGSVFTLRIPLDARA
ncbi:MAG: GAF domain-containing protein [Gemmatimonadetes bacterium]|nr:GAF domain-containing protein [Gemmatimonadota bacterium]